MPQNSPQNRERGLKIELSTPKIGPQVSNQFLWATKYLLIAINRQAKVEGAAVIPEGMTTHTCVYIYVYIYRGSTRAREREREGETHAHA